MSCALVRGLRPWRPVREAELQARRHRELNGHRAPEEEVAASIDAAFQRKGWPVAQDKVDDNIAKSELWGGRFLGFGGSLAFPDERRASLMLLNVHLPQELQQSSLIMGMHVKTEEFDQQECQLVQK